MKITSLPEKFTIPAGILLSGICWYLSNGLSGDYWYLVWLAPIPVLFISLKTSGKQTFFIAFISYLIGRLSWFTYLVSVATLIPAIIFTLLLPLVFAVIVTVSRKIVLRIDSWYSIFVFPVLFTTYEFLLISFSPDGSAASIAYSQSNMLSVIQIASLTGILGITFLVTFLPSAVAIGFYYRRQKNRLRSIVVISAILLIPAFLFGIVRIHRIHPKNSIKAGLVVLEEKFHNITDQPEIQKEEGVVEAYAQEISGLAAQGAKWVVLPERAINISKEFEGEMIRMLSNIAKQHIVYLVIGYTNSRNDPERNSAMVIDDQGEIVADYNKVHLVTGLERQFTPGSVPGLFEFNGLKAGVAICKDLDFPDYIKEYGRSEIGILAVPAWDFIKDDWLHSRMATMRGVECGFSQIRTARKGRLTISDCTGRVLYEASSSNGTKTILTGEVPVQHQNTLYIRFGDWFGILNVTLALCFILIFKLKKNGTA